MPELLKLRLKYVFILINWDWYKMIYYSYSRYSLLFNLPV